MKRKNKEEDGEAEGDDEEEFKPQNKEIDKEREVRLDSDR